MTKPTTPEKVDPERDLIMSMVGRRIVDAWFGDVNPGVDWTEHEMASLTLDDGRTIEFRGWGHDAWGITVILDEDP